MKKENPNIVLADFQSAWRYFEAEQPDKGIDFSDQICILLEAYKSYILTLSLENPEAIRNYQKVRIDSARVVDVHQMTLSILTDDPKNPKVLKVQRLDVTPKPRTSYGNRF